MHLISRQEFTGMMGAQYVPEPNTGCWLWVGAHDGFGYGMLNRRGTTYRAHRVAYEALRGPIPKGLQMDHLCRTPACVNPDHLEAVTARENTLRSNNTAGKNSRKTHCMRGHEFTPDNIYWQGKNRHCKTCNKEAGRLRYLAKKARTL